jgi:hypothetical protein
MPKTKSWHQRIDDAEKRGGFTEADKQMAKSWQTCACGRQDKRIPRCYGGDPADGELDRLGNTFNSSVRNDHFRKARKALYAIEKRAAEILVGMGVKG